MSSTQRARSGVPLDQRSAVPSVPGIPAWGAVAVAVGASTLGFLVDALRGTELTATFASLYVLGALIAVVAVRHRALFTAMVQPPLIMFVGVPIAYQMFSSDAGSSIKDIVLTVAVPLVDRFPLMFLTTLLVLGIGGARLALDRRPSPVARAARAARAEEKAPRGRAEERRRARSDSGSGRHGRRSRDRAVPAPSREVPPTPRDTPAPPSGRGTDRQAEYRRAENRRAEYPRPERRQPEYSRPEYSRPEYRQPEYKQAEYKQADNRQAERRHDDYRQAGYEPRRRAAESPSLTPYPAPRVRYRDRD